MARKSTWLLVLALATGVCAQAQPAQRPAKAGTALLAAISGQVRDTSGTPQMGAIIKVFSGAREIATAFTDATGHYQAASLPSGTYQVRASAPAFLPTQRDNLGLKAGAHLVVNLTLNTLFEAVEMLPPRRQGNQDSEDWKWTMRSAANRPVLRMLDDGTVVAVAATPTNSDGGDRLVKARVAFLAGSPSEGFSGAGDMTTAFHVETSLFSQGTVSVGGNVGYGAAAPAVLHAAYSHEFGSGSRPEISFTMRRFATPDAVLHNAALQAMSVAISDHTTIADILELRYGSELQSVQFRGHATAARPFGSATLHVSPNTLVEYRYATSEPNGRMAKGFETAPADLSESGPHLSFDGGQTRIEKARHQEVAVSHRFGDTSLQVAAFSDRIRNTALTGAGMVGDGDGLLPDVYSDTFTFNGGDFGARGLRLVAEQKLLPDLSATFDYSMGGALALEQGGLQWTDVRSALRSERRHALTGKVAGKVPGAHTHVIASYKWTAGSVLTPVDMFNVSAGQADPFFSVFVRQPLPYTFLSGKLEALIDMRNLLAQGYVPVVGQDGRTLYLVQSARSVRGGVAFTF